MKKLTCILAVMLMLCLCTIAYAADPVTLDITALDYQTGKAVSKTYVNNELFLLKVDLGIPRFFDLPTARSGTSCEPSLTVSVRR